MLGPEKCVLFAMQSPKESAGLPAISQFTHTVRPMPSTRIPPVPFWLRYTCQRLRSATDARAPAQKSSCSSGIAVEANAVVEVRGHIHRENARRNGFRGVRRVSESADVRRRSRVRDEHRREGDLEVSAAIHRLGAGSDARRAVPSGLDRRGRDSRSLAEFAPSTRAKPAPTSCRSPSATALLAPPRAEERERCSPRASPRPAWQWSRRVRNRRSCRLRTSNDRQRHRGKRQYSHTNQAQTHRSPP